MPQLPKPPSCQGCALQTKGVGWVPAVGPVDSPLVFIGESAGAVEVRHGEGFSGPAGGVLNRALHFTSMDRANSTIHNIIACRPPGDWLDGAPWEHGAIKHCAPNLDATLAGDHKVVVALGGLATRRLLDLPKRKGDGITVKDFHGTVNRSPDDRYWVVPTFHPSHIQRGAWNLFGTLIWDLLVAQRVLTEGFHRDEVVMRVDPAPDLFRLWARQTSAAAQASPGSVFCATDIETPDKRRKSDEGELKSGEDQSYQILWVNVCSNVDEGWTVPYQSPYIEILDELFSCAELIFVFWNDRYDVPRIKKAGHRIEGRIIDAMWWWHVLQSDVPRGLGYATPFFSNLGAWKHLGSESGTYRCLDAINTLRNFFGIVGQLQQEGMLRVADRYVSLIDQLAFRPSEEVGLRANPERAEEFNTHLTTEEERLYSEIQGIVPEEMKPLKTPGGGKGGLVRMPKTEEVDGVLMVQTKEFGARPLLAQEREVLVRTCRACLAQEISVKHRCTDKALVPDTFQSMRKVPRYFIREDFNPGSWQQVLAYILARGHKPGKQRKDRTKDSTDRKALDRLVKTGDAFYSTLITYREVSKVRGTYATPTLERCRVGDGRLHPTTTNAPSTGRRSMVDPNLTNVVADKRGKNLASGFRAVIEAEPATEAREGCKLVEVDFSAIEAVQTGWWCGDPVLYRLAKLGIHAFLCGRKPEVNQPAELSWSDEDLAAHFTMLKERFFPAYDKTKRAVYGTLYGAVPSTLCEIFPEHYPTVRDAEREQRFLFEFAPKLKSFHSQVREIAHRQHWLGGPGVHPYGHRHWFWHVLEYERLSLPQVRWREKRGMPVQVLQGIPYGISLGKDGKRVVAYYPQSTASFNLADAMLLTFDPELEETYIGDCYYGMTPLRAPIHDSLLMEVQDSLVERVLERVVPVMTREIIEQPLPWDPTQFLKIGVEAKVGQDWASMKKVDVSALVGAPAGVSGDRVREEDLSEDGFDEAVVAAVAGG